MFITILVGLGCSNKIPWAGSLNNYFEKKSNFEVTFQSSGG
jgi:hypothetical protein